MHHSELRAIHPCVLREMCVCNFCAGRLCQIAKPFAITHSSQAEAATSDIMQAYCAMYRLGQQCAKARTFRQVSQTCPGFPQQGRGILLVARMGHPSRRPWLTWCQPALRVLGMTQMRYHPSLRCSMGTTLFAICAKWARITPSAWGKGLRLFTCESIDSHAVRQMLMDKLLIA